VGLVARLLATVPEHPIDLGGADVAAPGPHDQLDRVHGAGSDLDFLAGAMLEQLAALDPLHQPRREVQHAIESQHVRHQVVGEHRELLKVAEPRNTRQREVRCGDLCPLEQRHADLPINRGVRETVPVSQTRHEPRRRAVGGASDGAIAWACGTPNILNVAGTRAQRRLYVVGDRARWMAASGLVQEFSGLPVEGGEPLLGS